MNPIRYAICATRRHHTWTGWSTPITDTHGTDHTVRSCHTCGHRQYHTQPHA